MLPMNAHIKATANHFYASVSCFPFGNVRWIGEFSSRDELIEAVLVSCSLPGVVSWRPRIVCYKGWSGLRYDSLWCRTNDKDYDLHMRHIWPERSCCDERFRFVCCSCPSDEEMKKLVDIADSEAWEWYKELNIEERARLFGLSRTITDVGTLWTNELSTKSPLEEMTNLGSFRIYANAQAVKSEAYDSFEQINDNTDEGIEDITEPPAEATPLVQKEVKKQEKIRNPFAGKNIQFSSQVFRQKSLMKRPGGSVLRKQPKLPPKLLNSCVEEKSSLLENIGE